MPNKANKRYIADEIMGEKGEVFSHSLLEKLFGKLERTKYKYDRFDYKNEKYIIELKTRSCNHNAFDRDKGLMFNYSKIEKMKKSNDKRDTYFAFNCKDGIYCWKYDDEKFSRGIGGRKDRGCVEMREMAYVLSKDMVCLYEKPKPYLLDSSDEED
tara:strand:- start:255 stop:722 length:468 start_codon:yes stop_codon:yes gene_type:complete